MLKVHPIRYQNFIPFYAENYSTVQTDHILSNHSFADGHFGLFLPVGHDKYLYCEHSCAMFVWTYVFVSLGCTTRNGNFLRNFHTVSTGLHHSALPPAVHAAPLSP